MPTGARVPSADAWASKALERGQAAGQAWVDGSLAPKRDPVAAALAKNDLRVARIQQSITDKTWESSMQRVDAAARDQTIAAVGAQGYAAGLRNREQKIRNSIAKLQPLVASHVAKIDGLPAKTDADMENRMLANLRGMKALGKAYKQAR
jgi:hypothetical protein